MGLVADCATGKLMGGARYGFITTRLGLAASGGMVYTIIVAIFGAIIVTLIVRLITGNKPT